MELEMGIAAVAIAAATAAAVYLISVMGIKEKTFEEVLAEQQKQRADLLGKKDFKKKSTVKDNKSKKLRKAKDREKAAEDARSDDRHHVEINTEPEFLDDDNSESRRASMVRREQIKPILVNKEEHSPIVDTEVLEPANHFEVLHPKDDLELLKDDLQLKHLKKSSSDELSLPRTPPPKSQKNKKGNKKANTEAVREAPFVAEVYEEISKPLVEETTEGTSSDLGSGRSNTPEENQDSGVERRSNKNKKNRKVEDKEVPSAAKLESMIDNLALSSFEIQNLIDILLNKQHAGDSEWVNKGKTDIPTLKKQLAEKEKQFGEEQLAVQQLQTKLKELRQEHANERTKLSIGHRQLEEALNQKDQVLQQLQLRLQQSRQEIGDKQLLQQKFQQLQISLNGLREENTALKNALSVEQSGRSKADSLEREAEALRTQCSHLEKQLNAAFQSNQELSNQIRTLQEHMRALEDMKKQEELTIRTQFSSQMQEREGHLLAELKKAQEVLGDSEQEKVNLRQQVVNLQNSARNAQDTSKALEDVNKKLEESYKTEKNTKNLLEDSKQQVDSLKSKLEQTATTVSKLEQEKSNLAQQITAMEAAHKSSASEQSSAATAALEKQLNELRDRLQNAESAQTDLQARNEALANEVSAAKKDLELQKEKNTELRSKNTKLLDTLNITEKNLENHVAQSAKSSKDVQNIARSEFNNEIRSKFESTFPQFSDIMSLSDWADKLVVRIKQELSSKPVEASSTEDVSLLQEANERLKTDVSHYQEVLASTESLLSSLQDSIEKEEKKWQLKFEQQESEMSVLRSSAPSNGTGDVPKQMSQANDEISVLQQRCSELEKNHQNKLHDLEQSLKEAEERCAVLLTEKSKLESLVAKEQEKSATVNTKISQLETELATIQKGVATADQNGHKNGSIEDASARKEDGQSPKGNAEQVPSATASNVTSNADSPPKEKSKKKKGASAKK